MNVHDFLPEIRTKYPEAPSVGKLLRMRQEDFFGFCKVEEHQGGIIPGQLLSLPEGQRNIRLLFARMVEEVLEAADASDPVHYQEELIDAINFGTSIMFLGSERDEDEVLSIGFKITAELGKVFTGNPKPVTSSDGWIVALLKAWSPLLEKLRNRSWQNGVQHPYFLGDEELGDAIAALWHFAAVAFDSYQEMAYMFIAKHRVLQFRLESNY